MKQIMDCPKGFFDYYYMNLPANPAVLLDVQHLSTTFFKNGCIINAVVKMPLRLYRFCLRDSNGILPQYIFPAEHIKERRDAIAFFGALKSEQVFYDCYNTLILQYSDNNKDWFDAEPISFHDKQLFE